MTTDTSATHLPDAPAGADLPANKHPDWSGDHAYRQLEFYGPDGPYRLTPKQEDFCRHFVACGNGAEAARRAQYAETSARYIARENLRSSKIRWRIAALRHEREELWRAERRYLLSMANAALRLALRQGKPGAMARCIALLGRFADLDRPADWASRGAHGDATDSDYALRPDRAPGLLATALLDMSATESTDTVPVARPGAVQGPTHLDDGTALRGDPTRFNPAGPQPHDDFADLPAWWQDGLAAAEAVTHQDKDANDADSPTETPAAILPLTTAGSPTFPHKTPPPESFAPATEAAPQMERPGRGTRADAGLHHVGEASTAPTESVRGDDSGSGPTTIAPGA